jgi:hypothetical protein
MGLLDMWGQARGAVMRKEYENILARMEDANAPAWRAFLNNVVRGIDALYVRQATDRIIQDAKQPG